MLIDNPTIRQYQLLTRRPAAIMPARREKGSYYIMTAKGPYLQNGYIMTVDGLRVGCSKPGDYSPYWITDLKTGLRIGEAKTLARVPGEVAPVLDTVKQLHGDLFNKKIQTAIKAIKKAYKANETALQAI